MVELKSLEQRCWVCNSSALVRIKESNLTHELDSESFAITDSNYGVTGSLDQCLECGFIQSSELDDVLCYYQALEDEEYDKDREVRGLQQRKLLERIVPFVGTGKLLDIGAGSGFMVEQAEELGFEAVGIEPCAYLQERAQERGLNVMLGTFPQSGVRGPFDVITLVDIIEHVPNPVSLFKDVHDALRPGGYGMVITPNASSLMARMLRSRWWHYRVAHIGYFTPKTLTLALKNAGLKPLESSRPGWYFKLDYIIKRLERYVPFKLPNLTSTRLGNLTIPLNLLDSQMVVFKRDA